MVNCQDISCLQIDSHPEVRIASVLLSRKEQELLLLGGEVLDRSIGASARLADVWTLDAPLGGWQPCSCPSPLWKGPWDCGCIANENVPTRRSNHAAIVCGEHLFVFGGWAADGITPLAAPELLHLETRCWTHCSTVNEPPLPRGNPTLVYSAKRHLAILYGGWNGHARLDDVWCLDMESWRWLPAVAADDCVAPAARTDHSSVLWQASTREEIMLVFGGSLQSGSSADLWALDCSCGELASWKWKALDITGPWPPARTSHASAIAGIGDAAALLIVGGQDSCRGSGAAAVLSDVWILPQLGSSSRHWTRLDWEMYPTRRCRHSIAIVSGQACECELAVVYGGYDGVSAIDDHHSLFVAPLPISVTGCQTLAMPANVSLQERWDAELPVTPEDLTENEKAKALQSRMPLAMAKALHRHAMKQTPPRDTYIDPDTGYSVFTQAYLKRRPCCGNGCRHCPHGHINVPTSSQPAAQKIDW